MTVRPFVLGDRAAAKPLADGLHRLHTGNRPDVFTGEEHPLFSEEAIRARLADPRAISLAAEEDGTVIGYCFAEVRPRTGMKNVPALYIDDLIVAEPFRRRGVARALFDGAVRLAREQGAVRVDLTVWSFNGEAEAFYRSLGMTPQRMVYEKKI